MKNAWKRAFCQRGRARLLGLLLTGILLATGCTTTKMPLTGIPLPVPDLPFRLDFWRAHDRDFSDMEWVASFDAVHDTLVAEYPFTEHKDIRWGALREAYRPRIVAAVEAEDPAAFYVALREYVYAVPDGNMGLYDNPEVREAEIGGGVGFAVLPLDDGRLIASVVTEEGPAAQAGMAWGAEILGWNDMPAADAVEMVPVLWARRPPATDVARRFEQARFLARMPAGETVTVTFQNVGEETPKTATLTALDDDFATLEATYLHDSEVDELESPMSSEILANGMGYIRLKFMAPTVVMPFPSQEFRASLTKMKRNNVRGLVLDVRGNTGGTRELIAKMLGHFFEESMLLEQMAYYDEESQAWEAVEEGRLEVPPRSPHYGGPLAVLVDYHTVSGGEAMPMVLKRRSGTVVAGLTGTHGSIAPAGGYIELPNDSAAYYPVGRSLNAAGEIQVESNAAGEGGVLPDLKVPVNRDTAEAVFAGGEDVVLDEAIEALEEMAPAPAEDGAQEGSPEAR
ncbi:MAG: S41 family peptidase [Candidatus Hydrogenedentota bacterium]